MKGLGAGFELAGLVGAGAAEPVIAGEVEFEPVTGVMAAIVEAAVVEAAAGDDEVLIVMLLVMLLVVALMLIVDSPEVYSVLVLKTPPGGSGDGTVTGGLSLMQGVTSKVTG